MRLAGEHDLQRPLGVREQPREPVGIAEDAGRRACTSRTAARSRSSARPGRTPPAAARAHEASSAASPRACARQSVVVVELVARARSRACPCPPRRRAARSSSSAIHVRACTPFVTEPIGTSSTVALGPEAVPHLARHLAVQRGDAVRVRRRAQRERRQPEAAVVRRRRGRARRTRPTRSRSARRAARRSARRAPASKTSFPAGTGVCVVNTVDARSRCSAASRASCSSSTSSRSRSSCRNAEWPSFMWNTVGSRPSARSARTPPMPSTSSCRSRCCAVAAVERVGDRPRPVRVAVDVGVEQIERHASDLRAPDLRAHGHERARRRRRARRPTRRRARACSGSRAGSFVGIALHLPVGRRRAAGGSSPRGRRGRRRRAGRRGRTPTSGGRRRARRGRPSRSGRLSSSPNSQEKYATQKPVVLVAALPPRAAAPARLSSSASTRSTRSSVLGRRRARELVVGELGEERRRVVVERGEALGVELREEGARAGQPAEPEVAGDLAQRVAQGAELSSACMATNVPTRRGVAHVACASAASLSASPGEL